MTTAKAKPAKKFFLRSRTNSKMVRTTSAEYMPESMVGPGGYAAMTWATRSAADKAAARFFGTVEECS